jgi:2-polyprenyl-3-methyl-5-hydroxy-6-metoxy-1,4-benzoquinol methylase
MNGLRKTVIKFLGLQHPHDKILEIFAELGLRGKVLDAGAGPGVISSKLKGLGFDVYAADINPGLFSAEGIDCMRVDLDEKMPYEDGLFDCILSSNLIEHLEDQYTFIRECYRVLREKGKLLVTTPNVLNLKARMANLLVGFNLFTGRPQNEVSPFEGGEHINMVNYYELRVNLHRNGFRIIHCSTHCYSNTALLLFWLTPLIYLFTSRGFKREKRPEQVARNREIFRHVLSADMLFGKKLFVVAEKDPIYVKRR